jgi:CheY-like chemotaxis protein
MAKILIVDDEERMLRLFSEILLREGYNVVVASDGKKGAELALSESPDLILLDVMMPSVDGTQVFDGLSKDPRTKNIPVAFLTALVREEEIESTSGKIGGHEYISKSTPKDKFVQRVKGLLSGGK